MNQLFYGDNLAILRKYIKDESVDLCYIDPPFNSKRNYNQIYNNVGREDKAQAQAFVDTWTWDTNAEQGLAEILTGPRSVNYNGSFSAQTINLIDGLTKVLGKGSLLAYVVSMTLRIVEIHRILTPTGSFYLHCDPSASHYLKIVLDAVFCSQGGDYRNEVIWKRTSSHNDAKRFAVINDNIFYYVKGKDFAWNEQHLTHSEKYIKSHYNRKDELGRAYRLDNIIRSASMGERPNLAYEYKGYKPAWGWRVIREKLEKLDEGGLIEWSKSGTPYLVRFLEEQKGVTMPTVWDDIPPINSQATERLGYPTQKPEALLERIIQASSNEGDTVLDAYCGCGTTVAVAQRLGRKWIGIDITYQSIALILKRLEDTYGKTALETVKLSGVPKDMASAVALAHKKDDRTRKEFEKWAVLTFSQNRAIINEKKGGDGGVDGLAFVLDSDGKDGQSLKPVIFSVKSNETLTPAVVRELFGTVEREKAAMGYLLTLNTMDNLVKESKKYGFYTNELFGSTYPKIEVISVEQILSGERIRIPLNQRIDVVKAAQEKAQDNQLGLF